MGSLTSMRSNPSIERTCQGPLRAPCPLPRRSCRTLELFSTVIRGTYAFEPVPALRLLSFRLPWRFVCTRQARAHVQLARRRAVTPKGNARAVRPVARRGNLGRRAALEPAPHLSGVQEQVMSSAVSKHRAAYAALYSRPVASLGLFPFRLLQGRCRVCPQRSNPTIERTFQRPLRALWPGAHVER